MGHPGKRILEGSQKRGAGEKEILRGSERCNRDVGKAAIKPAISWKGRLWVTFPDAIQHGDHVKVNCIQNEKKQPQIVPGQV